VESLSDMLKTYRQSSMLEAFERKKNELKADPLIRRLLEQYPDLTEQDFNANLPRLFQYVTEHRNCEACPGLELCPNALPGHYTRLHVERIGNHVLVNDRKTACRKYVARQAQEAVRRRIRSFYVDDREWQEGFSIEEMVSRDRDRSVAVNRIYDYVNTVRNEGLPTRGLYLVGDFGTGKTYLMGYLLHEMAKFGYTGVILYMPDFIEELKSMIGDGDKLQETMELLKNTDILVFDDIGSENLTPWVRDHVLAAILNYRMNRKPTFYTSNYRLEDLEKHFAFTSREGEEEHKGRRLMERVAHFVEVVEVVGANQRGRAS
jgi:primosomal protein DnaI